MNKGKGRWMSGPTKSGVLTALNANQRAWDLLSGALGPLKLVNVRTVMVRAVFY